MNDAAVNRGTGKLIIQVRTADGSIPVPGAVVRVKLYQNDTPILARLLTDSSGLTDTIEVETPGKEQSLSPSSNKDVYTSLLVQVDKEGFYSQEFIGVFIFPEITTVQTVNLLPLAEYTEGSPNTTFFESEGFML
jgi:hypothetical protein